jgi:ABC-type amino acid transport substrate-binding protein
MHSRTVLAMIAMVFAAGQAAGACAPLRLGYVNQHRPPFAIGAGSAVPPAAGASVDLVQEIGAAATCKVIPVRLPPLRLRAALESGAIDAMLLDAGDADLLQFALPLNKTGQLDRERALPMYTVVFVHTEDKLKAEADMAAYFSTHTLGVNNGASLAGKLRTLGMLVDDGAHDTARNLEKLARRRIDGYAGTLVSPDGMDKVVAAQYGAQLQRLDKPLRMHHFWLAFTKGYYAKNKAEVETMWDWMRVHGAERFAALVKKYEAPQ